MIFYIDEEYGCHKNKENINWRCFENIFFDNKCEQLINLYKYIPEGETYNGITGLSIYPIKDIKPFEIIQKEYEYKQILNNLIEEIYYQDLIYLGGAETVHEAILRLIENNKTQENLRHLRQRTDILYACGRLTEAEYTNLQQLFSDEIYEDIPITEEPIIEDFPIIIENTEEETI